MTGRRPADALIGLALDGGWTVTGAVDRADDATGGMSSISYIVERSAGVAVEVGFLKALDYTVVHEMPMPLADAMKSVNDAYLFERDLVLACAARRMTNVIRGIDAGDVEVPADSIDSRDDFLRKVPYIIFEIADGDVRTVVADRGEQFSTAWAMRVLHGVANGLRQLHQVDVFHQDLKPSNVMTFGSVGKVGDLGSAATLDGGADDDRGIAGDRLYSPPELLYGEVNDDVVVRRLAVDLYHLGSVACFLFCGSGMTSLVESELGPDFHWRTWPRDYRNALPYVRDAHDRVLDRIDRHVNGDWVPKFLTVLAELTDPDPLLRGSPRVADGRRRYAMDRYVSRFDLLARRAEIALTESVR